MTRVVTYVEIDVTYCALEYGVAPCTASGGPKCFNTLKTCQDRENFTDEPVTLRFAISTAYLDREIRALPCIENVSVQPGKVSLGQDLGQRASVTITMSDFKHADTGPGYDKYRAERDYDPFVTGTHWGKFRARQPYLRGRPLRLIRGEAGQSLDQMETRHYVVDSFSGPSTDGNYTIIAKDVLKLADGDRAQAPRPSSGFLVADIDESTATAVLAPTGVGNLEYPASGLVAIGGKEICSFTRSGNTLTLTRAQRGTEAQAHNAQDRVQLVLEYSGEDPTDIIEDLFVNYADIPQAFIPKADWLDETENHLRRLYTRTIAEPTSVRELVSDLVEQAALAVWWDDIEQLIRLQVLRPIVSDAALINHESYMDGTASISEQPDKRVSWCWVYFGQINPLRPKDDPDNYRSVDTTVDAQSQSDYGSAAIEKIYAPWIPAFARQVASRLGVIRVGRFRDAPRKINFNLFRTGPITPELGGGYQFEAWPIQNEFGSEQRIPIQITSFVPSADMFSIEAMEANFAQLDEDDFSDRVVTIDGAINGINLRTIHDQIFPPPDPMDPPTVTFIIDTNVIIGSPSSGVPAVRVGSWPAYIKPLLIIRGRIQGAGGRGGNANFGNGQAGGTALYTRVPVDIQFETGARVWGGGGGGAAGGTGSTGIGGDYTGSGGGGGAGRLPGNGGAGAAHSESGSPGSLNSGGQGGRYGGFGFLGEQFLRTERAGSGGGPGQQGGLASLSSGSRGAAGRAIDGVSFCDITGSGDVRGPQVN